jgi:hypothetical protein
LKRTPVAAVGSTVTDSSIWPIDMVMSVVTSPRCWTRMFVTSVRLNPCSSPLMV